MVFTNVTLLRGNNILSIVTLVLFVCQGVLYGSPRSYAQWEPTIYLVSLSILVALMRYIKLMRIAPNATVLISLRNRYKSKSIMVLVYSYVSIVGNYYYIGGLSAITSSLVNIVIQALVVGLIITASEKYMEGPIYSYRKKELSLGRENHSRASVVGRR